VTIAKEFGVDVCWVYRLLPTMVLNILAAHVLELDHRGKQVYEFLDHGRQFSDSKVPYYFKIFECKVLPHLPRTPVVLVVGGPRGAID
jgi:hypothetical protein